MDWLNTTAGAVTVITGVITIAQTLKLKRGKGPASAKGKKGKGAGPGSDGAPKVAADPAPVIEGVQVFSGDDKAYQEWVQNHPQGFVINTYQGGSPNYMALHKATCGSVSHFDAHKPGAFTERGLMKVCSKEVDRLREWAKAHGRADGSFTGKCRCTPS